MITDREFIKNTMPARGSYANKYSVGTLLCICGSYSMAGAAILSAKAALRMGAGLVRVAVPESIYPIVSAAVPEAVFLVLPDGKDGTIDARYAKEIISAANNCDAVLMGCGSKLCEDTKSLVLSLLYHAEVPLILDADGINALSKHINVLKDRVYSTVLTPHTGEMSRLTGLSTEEILGDRENVAQTFADDYGVTLVLKGKDTLIASPGEELIQNPTGNAGMAVAGSGDVLAGMIASLVAQGAPLRDASATGAYLHGLAGDIGAEELSEYSLLPTDITDRIPKAIMECLK